VSLRRDEQKTKTQSGNSPMFNETIVFHAEDPATVVVVRVYNREPGDSKVLIGQWFMTLKYFLTDPAYCWHEKGLEVTSDRWVSDVDVIHLCDIFGGSFSNVMPYHYRAFDFSVYVIPTLPNLK
jgi:hypothetical protein